MKLFGAAKHLWKGITTAGDQMDAIAKLKKDDPIFQNFYFTKSATGYELRRGTWVPEQTEGYSGSYGVPYKTWGVKLAGVGISPAIEQEAKSMDDTGKGGR